MYRLSSMKGIFPGLVSEDTPLTPEDPEVQKEEMSSRGVVLVCKPLLEITDLPWPLVC